MAQEEDGILSLPSPADTVDITRVSPRAQRPIPLVVKSVSQANNPDRRSNIVTMYPITHIVFPCPALPPAA